MSSKREATYHGADVVTRLRLWGPESDYNGIMVEAADTIKELRIALEEAEKNRAGIWNDGHEAGFWNGRESSGHGEMEHVVKAHAEAFNPFVERSDV